MLIINGAKFGDRNLTRRALQEAHPEVLLQPVDLLAHMRFRDIEFARRRRKALPSDDFYKNLHRCRYVHNQGPFKSGHCFHLETVYSHYKALFYEWKNLFL